MACLVVRVSAFHTSLSRSRSRTSEPVIRVTAYCQQVVAAAPQLYGLLNRLRDFGIELISVNVTLGTSDGS